MNKLLHQLLSQEESDCIDFKMMWYSKDESYEFIHDILCLSNAICKDKNRYIVIGVDDNKKTHKKTLYNAIENIKTAEEITQMLQYCMSKVPSILVFNEVIDNNNIYIIQITPNYDDLPYVLNKAYEYQIKDNGKLKTKRLIKNCIYSRINSRNTPKDESCDIEIVKKIILKQRGEDLDITEKYERYLNDTENWIKSGNSFYYNLNSNFKIVRINNEEDIRHFKKASSYREILVDTGISKDYWEHYNENSYDDYYSWFDVELYANNTLIKKTSLMEIFAKYFFSDKGLTNSTFYIPVRDRLAIDYPNVKNKESIINILEWKLCKIFFKGELPEDVKYDSNSAEKILDFINYEFLNKSYNYIVENKDWINNSPQK